MKYLSLQEIQSSLLNVVDTVDRFCKGHNLQYFLSGGTLLGAIRHNGFIPWDDDIDMMMPRPDYDKLFSLAKDGWLDDRYRLISYKNGTSLIPYAKVVDTRIRIDEEINSSSDYLWIDVFPLDAVPESETDCAKILKKEHHLRNMYALSSAPIGTGTTKTKAVFKIPLVILMRIKLALLGKDFYTRRILSFTHPDKYESSEYIASLAWCCGPQERMKKKELYPPLETAFCGRSYQIPNNWESYLTNMFGEYSRLPDITERVDHRFKAYYC